MAFPVSIGPTGRYLVDASGAAVFIHGDTPWSLEVQCTRTQIDTYLNDRQAKGFSAILFECMERLYSSQSPRYRNAQSGADPFTTMSPVSWTSRNDTYWQTVDYIVAGARARGILCFITPAYMGFGNNQNGDGWVTDTDAATTSALQNYGAFLAGRYGQGNVIWVMGGDYAGTTAQREKQWNIVTGMRSVNPDVLVAGHNARTDSDAYSSWGGYSGFNFNTIYTQFNPHTEAAIAYARAMPFVLIEGYYENENNSTLETLVRQAVVTVLSGGCGHFFGNNPMWGLGDPVANGGIGAAAALANYLNTSGTQKMANVRALFAAYAWWLLMPRTDSSLVTSSLGSGDSRAAPALASDGSFALVWKNDSLPITVNLAALSKPSIRARWFDPLNATYRTVFGSPFTNTGAQSFAHPGANSNAGLSWVLALD